MNKINVMFLFAYLLIIFGCCAVMFFFPDLEDEILTLEPIVVYTVFALDIVHTIFSLGKKD